MSIESRRLGLNSRREAMIATLHGSDIMAKLNELRVDKALCDVKLETADGRTMQAHRVILAAASKYFKEVFDDNHINKSSGVVKIPDEITGEKFQLFLDYVYGIEIPWSSANVTDLYPIAMIMNCAQLKNQCFEYATHSMLNLNSALDIYSLAENIQETRLTEHIANFLGPQFMTLIKSDQFLAMPFSLLCLIISNKRLIDDHRDPIREYIFKWVQHDPEARKQHIFKLVDYIKQ